MSDERVLRGQIPQGSVKMPGRPRPGELMAQARARRLSRTAMQKRELARRNLLQGGRSWGGESDSGPSCHEVSGIVKFEVVPFNPSSFCQEAEEAAGVQLTNLGARRIACLAWPEQKPTDFGVVLVEPGETLTPPQGELFWCGEGRILRGCCHLATDTDPRCCVPPRGK